MYVAECNEIPNLASQGTTVKAAMANLREAAELWLKCADKADVKALVARFRARPEADVKSFELAGI